MVITAALALLGATGALCAPAQNKIEVTASADKGAVKIGDVITYQVTVTCPPGTKLDILDAEARLKPFEIRDFSKETQQQDGKLRVTFTYRLQIFALDKQHISGLQLKYRLPDADKPQNAPVPTTTITVGSVLPKGTETIKDIRDPVPIRMGRSQWLLAALLAVAALALLALLAWLVIRYLRSRRPKQTERKLVEAHQRALRHLDELQRSGLADRADLKPFHTRLSHIMREYLQARFDIPAMQATTAMIDTLLADAERPADWRSDLTALLRHTDMIRFANKQAGTQTARETLRTARTLVQQSRPRPTPAAAAPSPSTTAPEVAK